MGFFGSCLMFALQISSDLVAIVFKIQVVETQLILCCITNSGKYTSIYFNYGMQQKNLETCNYCCLL